MVVSFAPPPSLSSSPCGADVSSILTDPKATHTQKHHLGPCFSCACVWNVWYVCRNLSCVYLSVMAFLWFICMNASSYSCACCWMCVFCWLWRKQGSGWCTGQTLRSTCMCAYVFCFSENPLVCVCVCVCTCLFTYPPPGLEFPDELCLWQVGSFGKSNVNHTKITHYLLAPSLLSHTYQSLFLVLVYIQLLLKMFKV